MGLANYGELKQSVIEWSKRGDVDLRIDDFILIAETRMLSNPTENLKIRQQNTLVTSTLSTSSRFLTLPASYLSMRKMTLIFNTTTRTELHFRTPAQMHVIDLPGTPTQYTVTDQLEFNILPDIAYTVEIQYIKGFTPITSTNTTNDVLTNNPDVYLWGTVWAAMRYAQDLEEEQRYLSLFNEAIAGANRKTREGQYGNRARIIPRGTKP